MQVDPPRPLNDAERQILAVLLGPDFPGVKALRQQVSRATVVRRCDCGCPTIDIEVPPDPPASSASTEARLSPVEGRVAPLGSEPVADIILFMTDGRMTSLEYVLYEGQPPTDWPTPDRVTAFQRV